VAELNKTSRKPASTVAEFTSARQHHKTGRPSWSARQSARWRVNSEWWVVGTRPGRRSCFVVFCEPGGGDVTGDRHWCSALLQGPRHHNPRWRGSHINTHAKNTREQATRRMYAPRAPLQCMHFRMHTHISHIYYVHTGHPDSLLAALATICLSAIGRLSMDPTIGVSNRQQT
jgi:hypothetical protein